MFNIQQIFHNLYSIIFFIVTSGIFFYLLPKFFLIFKKYGYIGKNSQNFSPVDEITLINSDSKCEIFYPFISQLITKPILYLIIEFSKGYIPPSFSTYSLKDYINIMPFFVQILIALIVYDIILYIRHRFVHEYMWSFHAIHHCAHKISWLTFLRLHPVDQITMQLIGIAFLSFCGFDPYISIITSVFYAKWNAFVHSNIHLDFPKPFKYIFASPNFHRWHHATDKEAHNTNYCILFSCFDYIMNTYYCPDNRLPKQYGSSMKTLDQHQETNILKELCYPFKRQIKKIKLYK